MKSLNKFLNIDFEYPGIEIKVEVMLMREYLDRLELGIKAVCDSYLESEMRNYDNSEYCEYKYIYDIAEEEIPRLIRLSLVVSIYTLFDNSMTQLLSYAQFKELKKLTFRDAKGKSPISKFNNYMKNELEFDFRISERSSEELIKINKIRNCIAHSNGSLSAMPEIKAKEIRKIKSNGFDLNASKIDVSYGFLKISMDCVESVIRELMDFMEIRYGFK